MNEWTEHQQRSHGFHFFQKYKGCTIILTDRLANQSINCLIKLSMKHSYFQSKDWWYHSWSINIKITFPLQLHHIHRWLLSLHIISSLILSKKVKRKWTKKETIFHRISSIYDIPHIPIYVYFFLLSPIRILLLPSIHLRSIDHLNLFFSSHLFVGFSFLANENDGTLIHERFVDMWNDTTTSDCSLD